MILGPEITERIQVVETNLVTLDPILRQFCERHGYTFRSHAGIWPRRGAWRREEVDRGFDLTMDLTVPELMELGFSPDMPWSLHVTASSRPTTDHASLVQTEGVFRGLPFLALHERLAGEFEAGLARLQTFTEEAIYERGKAHGHAA